MTDPDHTVDEKSNVEKDPSRPTILLYPTGVYFTPFQPKPDDLDIRCLAHGLAGTNRYNGHTRDLINVAHHSVIVSVRVQAMLLLARGRDERDVEAIRDAVRRGGSGDTTFVARSRLHLGTDAVKCLGAELHDAPEGVSGYGDVTGPMKRHPWFKERIERLESGIADAVAMGYRLPKGFEHDPITKAADAWAFAWENRDLRGIAPPAGVVLPEEVLKPLSRNQARVAFLARYVELTGRVGETLGWPHGEVTMAHLDSWTAYGAELLRIVCV